jgi:hypothetical protein
LFHSFIQSFARYFFGPGHDLGDAFHRVIRLLLLLGRTTTTTTTMMTTTSFTSTSSSSSAYDHERICIKQTNQAAADHHLAASNAEANHEKKNKGLLSTPEQQLAIVPQLLATGQ